LKFAERPYNPATAGLGAGNPTGRDVSAEFEETFPDIGSMTDEELEALTDIPAGKVTAAPGEERA
jgi:hypothetical protein